MGGDEDARGKSGAAETDWRASGRAASGFLHYNEEAGGYDKHAETIRDLLVQNQGVQVREESKAERA